MQEETSVALNAEILRFAEDDNAFTIYNFHFPIPNS